MGTARFDARVEIVHTAVRTGRERFDAQVETVPIAEVVGAVEAVAAAVVGAVTVDNSPICHFSPRLSKTSPETDSLL